MWRYTQILPRICADADFYLKTTGKVAFLLRCIGPCSTFLEPTALETYPGEILTLYHTEGSSPTLNDVLLKIGEQLNISQPARISVGSGDTVLFCLIFRKS